jgi:mannose-6-phosphate isomerase class I
LVSARRGQDRRSLVRAPEEPRLLVKFLFTSEKLSVQVHPGIPRGPGKTEMWHVLRAAPDACLALGFERPSGPR